MKRKKLIDICLSAIAAFVLLIVALAFAIEMRKGATPAEAQQHYEEMIEPLPPPVVIEPSEEPNKVVVEDNKEVTQKLQRKGIFRFLRRRRK